MAITGIKLRCPLAQCESMKVVVPSGETYASGDLVQHNDVVGIVVEPAAAGEEAVIITKAPEALLPCSAAATAGYAVGEKVYADLSGNEVTEESSGTVLCGTVTKASSVGDTEVLVNFDGRLSLVA